MIIPSQVNPTPLYLILKVYKFVHEFTRVYDSQSTKPVKGTSWTFPKEGNGIRDIWLVSLVVG